MDKLSEVFERLSISAQVFYSGSICGLSSFEDPDQNKGYIHVLRSGQLEVQCENSQQQSLQQKSHQTHIVKEPSVIFHPRAIKHRLITEKDQEVELVCATIQIGEGPSNPLANALSSSVIVPLASSEMLAKTTEWLFDEAFNDRQARQPVVDRLSEIVVIQLLRVVMEDKSSLQGLLNGLVHPQLAPLIQEIHSKPEHDWNLDMMANIAMMSRSRFALTFKEVVGQTPADYLMDWRISLAQGYLRKGHPVSWVANKVGYPNGSGLARVFRKKLGISPKDWQQNRV